MFFLLPTSCQGGVAWADGVFLATNLGWGGPGGAEGFAEGCGIRGFIPTSIGVLFGWFAFKKRGPWFRCFVFPFTRSIFPKGHLCPLL